MDARHEHPVLFCHVNYAHEEQSGHIGLSHAVPVSKAEMMRFAMHYGWLEHRVTQGGARDPV